MLPDEFKPAFLSFFSEVDRFTSKEVGDTKGDFGETNITERLMRCVDLNDSGNFPDGLLITAADFQESLTEIAKGIKDCPNIEFEIKTEKFGQIFEGRVTQSDYALHLSFEDNSSEKDDANYGGWDAYYFMQAKISKQPGNRRARNDVIWSRNARFEPNSDQNFAIQCARELLGAGLMYNLYCPTNALKLDHNGHVYRKLQNYFGSDSCEWDHTTKAGLWISQDFPSTIGELFESPAPTTCPWALFLLNHYFENDPEDIFMPERIFCQSDIVPDKMALNRRKLFERDSIFINELEEHLIRLGAIEEVKVPYKFSDVGYQPTISIGIKFPMYEYLKKLETPPPSLTPF